MDQVTELKAMIARGNHKSAKDEAEQVKQLLLKDISHRFLFLLLPCIVPLIKGALVQPFGLAKQVTLLKDGTKTPKLCLTQDLSYSESGPNRLVNSRIDMDHQ
jgi:hypothetical protein